MTDANRTPGTTPPGWYADPWGAAPQRWWDGTQWTAHVSQPGAPVGQPAAAVQQPGVQQPGAKYPASQQPAAQPYQQPAQPVYTPAAPVQAPRPQLDPATPVGTVWIWLIVLLPVVSLALLPFIQIKLPAIDVNDPSPVITDPIALIGGPIYFVLIAVSWLTYAATVVFSWLDYRELTRRGVARPFHWAWSFLSSLVYVIGRTVIVGQVAQRRGKAPLWAAIGVIVLSFIVTIVWTAMLFSSIGDQISRMVSTGA